jgi:uncharacterized protein DUF1833
MSRYSDFFLASPPSVAQLELVEVSHPSFSQVFRVVRNATQGVTVMLETGEIAAFSYLPLRITPDDTRDTLGYGITVDLGDLGDLIPAEIERALAAGTTGTKPTLTYRVYRSDDLSAPIFGPIVLEVAEVGLTREGARLVARAPAMNTNRTGEVYAIRRFSPLWGLIG